MSKAQTFARMVRENGPLPVGLASDCARQACLGLQHIHEKRLVHRDIKPSNLMLDRNGVVKILDLKLAHIRHLDPISGTMSFLYRNRRSDSPGHTILLLSGAVAQST